MPKKQRQHYTTKPPTAYVHPSLSTSASTSGQTRQDSGPSSVNDRLELLRRIQGQRVRPKALEEGLSASQHAPRPSRRTAGPPPPRSWLVGGEDEASADQPEFADRLRPLRTDALPGREMPAPRSLMDMTMRNMARDIDWHIMFDRQYLSLLPLELRDQLMSYIACFGPNSGISLAGLRCIFSTDEELQEQGAASPSELRRLDLAGSIGRALPLKELDRAWTKKSRAKAKPQVEELVESWEEEVDLRSLSLTASPLWLPSLTHLSLAYPPSSISWTDLLTFSRHLGAVTHLSLAGWPRPSLPRASGTHRHGNAVQLNDNHDDARGILRLLSRNTPSLTYVSVARCHSWFDDMSPRKSALDHAATPTAARATPSRPPRRTLGGGPRAQVLFEEDVGVQSWANEDGAEWAGAWRHVAHVDVSQEGVPRGLQSWDLRSVHQGRTGTAQGPTWELPGADERSLATQQQQQPSLRVIAPTAQIEGSMKAQARRRAWLANEGQAMALAARVRALRGLKGLARCEFGFGWDAQTLLAGGYEEHVLFEAGM